MTMFQHHQRYRKRFILLIWLYFAAALWIAVRLPPYAAPNELLNVEYVIVMRQIRGLPNRGLVDSELRYTEWHQPPFYFTFAALVGLAIPVAPSSVNPPPPIEVEPNPHYLSTPRGNRGPTVHVTPQNSPLLYTSRFAAALLGVLGLAALYRAATAVYAPWIALLMTSLLAFQPNVIHLSGAVNNDLPLVATTALVLAYAILLLSQLRRDPARLRPLHAAGLGALAALAILTKANGVFVLAFLVVVLLAVAFGMANAGSNRHPGRTFGRQRALGQSRGLWRSWGLRFLLPAVSALVIPWGAWLVLNALRMKDALGLSGSLPVGRVLALRPADFVHLWPYLPYIWRSFWLDWSAGDVGFAPGWVYGFWLVGIVAMLAGWGVSRRAPPLPRNSLAAGGLQQAMPELMILAGFLALSYLYFAVKALAVKEAGTMVAEGRWWLPVMVPLAWLAGAGFARWWPPRLQERMCLLAASVPVLFLLGLLAFHLPYLYPRAEKVADGCLHAPAACLPAGMTPGEQTIIYGDVLELVAAEISPQAALLPGENASQTFELLLIWRALADLKHDYTVSVQLLAPGGDEWEKLGEHHSYPGAGLNPTRGWRAGDVYRDRLALTADGTLSGPTRAAVAIWLLDGKQRLPTRRLPDTDEVTPFVGQVVVRPWSPLRPQRGLLTPPVQFGSIAQLEAAEVHAGPEEMVVVLWWRAQQTTPVDYNVFVHVLDQDGGLIAQRDAPPNQGRSLTSIWQMGDVTRDVHLITLPAALPDEAGGEDLTLLVGLYDPQTGERLPARAGDQPLPANAFVLPRSVE